MDYLSEAVGALGAAASAVLLFFLLFGSIRSYPTLFIYCAAQLAATSMEIIVFRRVGTNSHVYNNLYWTNEVVLDLLLFVLVILLTFKALEGNPLRDKAGRFLAIILVGAIVAPFVVFYGRPVFRTSWFNGTSQMLNFGAAIMNLVLWTALLTSKRRDPQLLTVSIGLGIAATAAAVSYGIRQFTPNAEKWLPDLFMNIAHIASVLIWCWAFRPGAPKPAPAMVSGR